MAISDHYLWPIRTIHEHPQVQYTICILHRPIATHVTSQSATRIEDNSTCFDTCGIVLHVGRKRVSLPHNFRCTLFLFLL